MAVMAIHVKVCSHLVPLLRVSWVQIPATAWISWRERLIVVQVAVAVCIHFLLLLRGWRV